MLLTQKVNKLEDSLLEETVKITPKNEINDNNFSKIVESANIAMNRFNKRINNEG